MAVYSVIITGVSPLLLHRFAEAEEVREGERKIHIASLNPREVAEAACYRTNKGEIYFPGMAIARMLREAGSSYKQRGSRKSLKYIVSGSVLVLDDQILLRDVDGEPLTEFEVDSRPVVIPTTKGRIMRHRPRLNMWSAEFSLQVDETLIDADTVHQLLVDGGQQIGICDFRPERGGPFGRFQIHRWQMLGQQEPKEKPKLKVA